MVQVIYDFLNLFIGDIAFNDNLTLMNLLSYIITIALFSFILLPVFSIFKSRRSGK